MGYRQPCSNIIDNERQLLKLYEARSEELRDEIQRLSRQQSPPVDEVDRLRVELTDILRRSVLLSQIMRPGS